MLNKKGVELSTNLIIIIVLGIIVLIVAVIFFRTQVTKGAEKYDTISSGLDKCESFFGNRECRVSCDNFGKEVKPIGGDWADCGKGNLKDKTKCCEV
jgi:hypothetical protein